jgi:hypothetical protein
MLVYLRKVELSMCYVGMKFYGIKMVCDERYLFKSPRKARRGVPQLRF